MLCGVCVRSKPHTKTKNMHEIKLCSTLLESFKWAFSYFFCCAFEPLDKWIIRLNTIPKNSIANIFSVHVEFCTSFFSFFFSLLLVRYNKFAAYCEQKKCMRYYLLVNEFDKVETNRRNQRINKFPFQSQFHGMLWAIFFLLIFRISLYFWFLVLDWNSQYQIALLVVRAYVVCFFFCFAMHFKYQF